MVLKFRTEIPLIPSETKISHSDILLSLGSCFAENIGDKLTKSKFSLGKNPYGILFNPSAIAYSIRSAINEVVDESLFVEHEGIWSSFSHHSVHNAASKTELIENIKVTNHVLKQFVLDADWLILTFGTAWVYRHLELDFNVANCHKVANKCFEKRLLSVTEIVDDYKDLINMLREVNPKLKIIAAISPVRHLKDGAIENQRSKSTLHLALEELKRTYNFLQYFPSYEIVIDELRDYRFYEEDMLHPNNQAIEYIWEKFSLVYFSEQTQLINSKIELLSRALNHKPFNSYSSAHQEFLKKTIKIIQELEALCGVSFDQEKAYLVDQLI